MVGIDISAPLVELARERASQAGAGNVEFVVSDVQTGGLGLGALRPGRQPAGGDVLRRAAGGVRRHPRRAASTGGRLVFACWQGVEQNPWHTGTALRPFVPPPRLPGPGKSPVGPFSLGDDEYVRDVLGGAGFSDVESTALEITVRAPASAVVDRSLFGFMGVAPERLDGGRDGDRPASRAVRRGG